MAERQGDHAVLSVHSPLAPRSTNRPRQRAPVSIAAKRVLDPTKTTMAVKPVPSPATPAARAPLSIEEIPVADVKDLLLFSLLVYPSARKVACATTAHNGDGPAVLSFADLDFTRMLHAVAEHENDLRAIVCRRALAAAKARRAREAAATAERQGEPEEVQVALERQSLKALKARGISLVREAAATESTLETPQLEIQRVFNRITNLAQDDESSLHALRILAGLTKTASDLQVGEHLTTSAEDVLDRMTPAGREMISMHEVEELDVGEHLEALLSRDGETEASEDDDDDGGEFEDEEVDSQASSFSEGSDEQQ